MEFLQTDNAVSAWDLTTDKLPFVRVENRGAFVGDAPIVTSPLDFVSFICETECAVPFLKPVSSKEKGYAARIKSPMDLGTVLDKATNNKYGGGEAGWDALKADFSLIIKNAKLFNQPERYEWRLADMLEAEVKRVWKTRVCVEEEEGGGGAGGGSAPAGEEPPGGEGAAQDDDDLVGAEGEKLVPVDDEDLAPVEGDEE